MIRYIFDLDGTLVSSGQSITKKHKQQLLGFAKHNYSYIVTGSDYDSIVNQLGEDLVPYFDFIFATQGNSVYKNNELYSWEDWIMSDIMRAWLYKHLKTFCYAYSSPVFIEKTGSISVKFLGTNPTLQDRLNFTKWSDRLIELRKFCYNFNSRFPTHYCTIGGETSVDIVKKTKDKSQIIKYFSDKDELVFFCDKAFPLGNDYTLASTILEKNLGKVYTVNKVSDTYDILTAISQ